MSIGLKHRNSFHISRMKKTHICIWAAAIFVFLVVVSKRNIYVPPENVQRKDQTDKLPTATTPSSPVSSDSGNDSNNHPTSPATTPTIEVGTTPHSNPTPRSNPLPPPTLPPTTPPKTNHHPTGTTTTTSNGDSVKPITVSSQSYNMTQTEQQFVTTWCDLNQNKVEWYPSGTNEWQQRAPYVILPGEKHCGTSVLYQALLDHSSFVAAAKSEEMGFFLPRNFKRYVSGTITKVLQARQRMYAQDYKTTLLKQTSSSSTSTNDENNNIMNRKVSVDATSGYLFYSSARVPEHILCVAPWNKLIVVLRDPVDRVYSQWAHGKSFLRLQQSFEDWMAPELSLMQTVGLVRSEGSNNGGGGATNSLLSVEEEDEAWAKYQKAASVPSNLGSAAQGGIGRSMYVIFLRQWITAYKNSGKDIKHSIYLVRAEDLANQFEYEFDKILRFLNLPKSKGHTRQDGSIFEKKMQSALSLQLSNSGSTRNRGQKQRQQQTQKQRQQQQIPPMNEETRKMLKDFFAPYNDGLYDLIKKEFGESVWKDKTW